MSPDRKTFKGYAKDLLPQLFGPETASLGYFEAARKIYGKYRNPGHVCRAALETVLTAEDGNVLDLAFTTAILAPRRVLLREVFHLCDRIKTVEQAASWFNLTVACGIKFSGDRLLKITALKWFRASATLPIGFQPSGRSVLFGGVRTATISASAFGVDTHMFVSPRFRSVIGSTCGGRTLLRWLPYLYQSLVVDEAGTFWNQVPRFGWVIGSFLARKIEHEIHGEAKNIHGVPLYSRRKRKQRISAGGLSSEGEPELALVVDTSVEAAIQRIHSNHAIWIRGGGKPSTVPHWNVDVLVKAKRERFPNSVALA